MLIKGKLPRSTYNPVVGFIFSDMDYLPLDIVFGGNYRFSQHGLKTFVSNNKQEQLNDILQGGFM